MPMKSTRVISISIHDGLHSLKRLNQYFLLPEERRKTELIQEKNDLEMQRGSIVINNPTRAAYPHTSQNF